MGNRLHLKRWLSFSWPFLRYPLMWSTLAWLGSMVAFAAAIWVLIAVPDKWDRAIALKVCGGLPIVQQQDGSIWLRHRWRAYRVLEKWEELC